jgi:hypothetical protein
MDMKEEIQVVSKKEQNLVDTTIDNILLSRTATTLENLFNVVDVEIKRFQQSDMMKSAMENAYKVILELRKRK